MDKKRTISLDVNKAYLYLKLMSGDADAYHFKVIEYDPNNEKEVTFVDEILAYYNKYSRNNTCRDRNKEISYFNGRFWMTFYECYKIPKGETTFEFDSYSYWSATYKKHNIKYLMRFYVLCNSIFFYYSTHSGEKSSKEFDEHYKELLAIKEKFAGKKLKVPKVTLCG